MQEAPPSTSTHNGGALRALRRWGPRWLLMASARSGMVSGELLDRVRSKRAEVDKYLAFNSRRRCLLVNLVIIAGALAALLTAPPAVGGKPFTDWLQQLFHSSDARMAVPVLVRVPGLAGQRHRDSDTEVRTTRGTHRPGARIASRTRGPRDLYYMRKPHHHEATGQFLKCLEDSSFMEPARATVPSKARAHSTSHPFGVRPHPGRASGACGMAPIGSPRRGQSSSQKGKFPSTYPRKRGM